jgi:SAM-dependent methyltransferase
LIADYLEYERRLWHETLLPVLRRHAVDLDGARVLDIGCGHAGMLVGLGESFVVAEAVGIDLDDEMLAHARRAPPQRTRLLQANLFDFDDAARFDAVFLRDVLEHIGDPARALERAVALTRPGGVLFLSHAPFRGPFGGHQHNAHGLLSHVPWLQLLPEALFRRLVDVRGNAYKGAARLSEDIDSVLATRLSLGAIRRTLDGSGLVLLERARYLVRPDYRIKFGLPTVALPPVPDAVADLVCTAEELLLRRPSR